MGRALCDVCPPSTQRSYQKGLCSVLPTYLAYRRKYVSYGQMPCALAYFDPEDEGDGSVKTIMKCSPLNCPLPQQSKIMAID